MAKLEFDNFAIGEFVYHNLTHPLMAEFGNVTHSPRESNELTGMLDRVVFAVSQELKHEAL